MKKVVVIGGGFAGSRLAKLLERRFEVILIDSKDYFEFTPGILRTIVEPGHIKKLQISHSDYLKKTRVVIGEVTNIEDGAIFLGKKKFSYDYLAICSGSSYNEPFKADNLITAMRAKVLKKYSASLAKAEKVIVIGGGLVGVEIIGEILDKYPEKQITLVHGQKNLIQRNNQKAIDYVTDFILGRGVKIVWNERVVRANGRNFLTGDGKLLEADIAFSCTGIVPNFEFLRKNFSSVLDSKNRIAVNNFLQVEGMKNVFAAGDVTNINEEKTAQSAEKQAKFVSKNIFALEGKRKMKAYKPRSWPLIISLGRYDGIYTYRDFNMYGKIPALMKWIVEKWVMLEKRNF